MKGKDHKPGRDHTDVDRTHGRHMTRIELLQHLITQARDNGFEFRKWFRTHTARPWTSAVDAVEWLAQGSRSLTLLFSHDFARAFFREGERIRFIQPALAYQRLAPDGSVKQVKRRAHTRQSNREDVWLYHLRAMAAAEEPLRYIRRYLLLEETLQEASQATHSRDAALGTDTPESVLPQQSSAAEPEPVDYDDELLVRD
jgi:hypothetical protein